MKTFFSWVVPCERARTQLSEYVGHIGVQMIKTIVIAGQSQDRAAKVGLSRKIGDVTKNRYALKKLFKAYSSQEEQALKKNL